MGEWGKKNRRKEGTWNEKGKVILINYSLYSIPHNHHHQLLPPETPISSDSTSMPYLLKEETN